MTHTDIAYATAGRLVVDALAGTDKDHPMTAEQILAITGELPIVRSNGELRPADLIDVASRTNRIFTSRDGYYLGRVRDNGRGSTV